jgi:tripartite-type tricarboxylate transporter receptor subunit TctC
MPKDVVEKLNSAIAKIFQNPEFQERFLKPNLFTPITSSPKEFATFINADSKKWKEVVEAANIKLDQ